MKDERPSAGVKERGIMVDRWATSHIVNDIGKFESFVDAFQPDSHSVELADRTKCIGVAQRSGIAIIYLLDNARQQHRAQLRDTLYIPTYLHDIFSVSRATNGQATITLQKGDNCMVTRTFLV